MNSLSSAAVINGCKSIFARMGIPESLHSDKGVQFMSKEFAQFAEYWGFTHTSSSPNHQSGNGEAERAVQTVKNLLRKEKEPYLALLNYRATPLLQGQSPAELLMHRQLRTRIPVLRTHKSTPQHAEFRARDAEIKARMKKNFDKRHRARELPPVREGQEVWIKTPKTAEAVVVQTQRSVPVSTSSGRLTSRNRSQIRFRNSSATIHPPSIPKDSTKLPPDQEEARPMVVLPSTQDDAPEPTEPKPPVLRRSERERRPTKVLDM